MSGGVVVHRGSPSDIAIPVPHAIAFNPGDATTYYHGSLSWLIVAQWGRIFIPRAGVIRRVDINALATGVTASSETSTLSLRLNNTTDYNITSVLKLDAAMQSYSKTDFSIAVAAGDFFELKWITPTWVTNPTNVYISGMVLMS